jgi:ketosteroid isomerase-like protein
MKKPAGRRAQGRVVVVWLHLHRASGREAPPVVFGSAGDVSESRGKGGGSEPPPAILTPRVAQENVETVRRVIEATNRRDAEAAISLIDPAIECDARGLDLPDLSGVYRGYEEVFGWWWRWFEAWREVQYEIEELIPADEDVVIGTRVHCTGRDGIEVDLYFVNLMTLRDGKLVRNRLYRDMSAALEAIGVSEGADSG